MSCQWIDSFSLGSDTAIAERYTSGAISDRQTESGWSGQCVRMKNTTLTKTVTASAIKVVGFRLKQQSAFACDFLKIQDGATVHVYASLNSNGTISVYRGGGVLLGTSTNALVTNVKAYIELKVLIHDTAGTVTLRVNEQAWLTLIGIDIRNGGNASSDTVVFGNSSSTDYLWFDDLYIEDTNLWGNTVVEQLTPEAAGSLTQWNRGGSDSGQNYSQIDDSAQNSDVDYVYYSASGVKDRYAIPGLSAGASGQSIRTVQITSVARKDDVLDRGLQTLLYSGGHDYFCSQRALSTSYVYDFCINDRDPATSTYWSYSGISSLEIGQAVYM